MLTAHLDIGTEYSNERIKPVGAPDGVFRSDKLGVVSLELLVLLTLEVPASVHHAAHRLVDLCSVKGSYVF